MHPMFSPNFDISGENRFNTFPDMIRESTPVRSTPVRWCQKERTNFFRHCVSCFGEKSGPDDVSISSSPRKDVSTPCKDDGYSTLENNSFSKEGVHPSSEEKVDNFSSDDSFFPIEENTLTVISPDTVKKKVKFSCELPLSDKDTRGRVKKVKINMECESAKESDSTEREEYVNIHKRKRKKISKMGLGVRTRSMSRHNAEIGTLSSDENECGPISSRTRFQKKKREYFKFLSLYKK
jgi:hypothetical protein